MSELALKLIAENKKTRATFLDLGRCSLTRVPDKICELVWLESLSFSNEAYWNGEQWIKCQNTGKANNIKRLGKGIIELKQLKTLYLCGELFERRFYLNDLSPLSSLSELQELDISSTLVSDLSPLSGLSKLKELYTDSTPINDLSPLSNLSSLHCLSISLTQVEDCSPLSSLNDLQELNISLSEIEDLSLLSGLRYLEKLNVSATKVSDLNQLSGMIALHELDVHNTQISDLSPLSGLIALQELNISATKVNDLSSLADLRALQLLDISYTQISDLSPLSGLIALQELNISVTKVNDLSPLADLRALQLLDISYTQISDLSSLLALIEQGLEVKWSSSFGHGNGIFVGACPLTNPPEAIVRQGNAAILNYFKEKQEQGTDHLYEAKLLIVGAGGAGKTSLIRRLYQTTKPLPKEHETTKGIDVYQHKFTVQDSHYPNGREFWLNVWDFAGQEQYRPADTFFFTQRSLYVLLDDTRNDDKTVQDACFKYWLEAVDCFSDNSPVLIFQNEKGGRSKAIDLAGIKAKFCSVKDCYQGNLEHNNAADKVRDAIEFYAKQLPHIGEELPAKWINIRAEIEQQAEQKPTISLDEYFALYEKHLPFDETKALHLSRYLHDLGVFLHFQDDELLSQTVILQNQWATEAVFKILDDETVKAKLGRFNAEDCKRLWQDSDYKRMHLQLRALMEKFELCYLLQDSNPKTWLAPQLLPPSKPDDLKDWAKAGDLVLRYRYEFLPKGMINRLMVRKHYFVPRPELAWLTGVLFERNGTQVLVELSPKGDEIIFRARGIERKELLSIISAELEALNATFKGLAEKVAVLIPCCCALCQSKTDPEAYEQKRLLKRKQDGKPTIECPASYEDVNVSDLLDGVQITKRGNMKKIFISYSKHDKQYKDELIEHLSSLIRQNKIKVWSDENLLAGDKWDESIKNELHNADIVLYLVSSKSLATSYIQETELPIVKQRCDTDKCLFVPIILKPCDWTEEDCAIYNALPRKGKPVTTWESQDEAWLEVVKGIKQIVND